MLGHRADLRLQHTTSAPPGHLAGDDAGGEHRPPALVERDESPTSPEPGENYYYGDRIDLEGGQHRGRHQHHHSTAITGRRLPDRGRGSLPSGSTTKRLNATSVEQDQDARPAIAGRLPTLDSYDTVLLGSPIWNVRPPMIMRTFIVQRRPTAARTSHPFVTYAVSGMGNTIEDYTRLSAQTPSVGEGLAVRGEEARDARNNVSLWVKADRTAHQLAERSANRRGDARTLRDDEIRDRQIPNGGMSQPEQRRVDAAAHECRARSRRLPDRPPPVPTGRRDPASPPCAPSAIAVMTSRPRQ